MGGVCCCGNDTKQQAHSTLESDEEEFFGNATSTPLLHRLARQQREAEEQQRAINFLQNNGEDSAPPMYLSRTTSSSIDNLLDDPLSPYFEEGGGGGGDAWGGGGGGGGGGWGRGSGGDPRVGFYSSSLPSSLSGSFCGPSPRWGGGSRGGEESSPVSISKRRREGGGKRRKVSGSKGVYSSSLTSSSLPSSHHPTKRPTRSHSTTSLALTLSPSSALSSPSTPLFHEWEQKYLPPKSHFSAQKLLLGQYQILKVFGVEEGEEEEGEGEEGGVRRGRGLYLVGVKDKREREGEEEGEGREEESLSTHGNEEYPVFVAKLVEKDEGIGKITPSRLLATMSDLAQIQGVENENLLTLCNSRCYKDSLYLFYEYFADAQSILSFFEKTELTLDFLISSSLQILNGLEFLHSLKICHRAVICRNILIHPSGHVKLAYSQLTPAKFPPSTKNIPNTQWMPPEMYNGCPYLTSSDIWSFGCCMLELLLSTSVFVSLWGGGGRGGKERGNLFWSWLEGEGGVMERVEVRHLGLERGEARMFLDVIGGCFEIDPNERITIPELKKQLEKLREHMAEKEKK